MQSRQIPTRFRTSQLPALRPRNVWKKQRAISMRKLSSGYIHKCVFSHYLYSMSYRQRKLGSIAFLWGLCSRKEKKSGARMHHMPRRQVSTTLWRIRVPRLPSWIFTREKHFGGVPSLCSWHSSASQKSNHLRNMSSRQLFRKHGTKRM